MLRALGSSPDLVQAASMVFLVGGCQGDKKTLPEPGSEGCTGPLDSKVVERDGSNGGQYHEMTITSTRQAEARPQAARVP